MTHGEEAQGLLNVSTRAAKAMRKQASAWSSILAEGVSRAPQAVRPH